VRHVAPSSFTSSIRSTIVEYDTRESSDKSQTLASVAHRQHETFDAAANPQTTRADSATAQAVEAPYVNSAEGMQRDFVRSDDKHLYRYEATSKDRGRLSRVQDLLADNYQQRDRAVGGNPMTESSKRIDLANATQLAEDYQEQTTSSQQGVYAFAPAPYTNKALSRKEQTSLSQRGVKKVAERRGRKNYSDADEFANGTEYQFDADMHGWRNASTNDSVKKSLIDGIERDPNDELWGHVASKLACRSTKDRPVEADTLRLNQGRLKNVELGERMTADYGFAENQTENAWIATWKSQRGEGGENTQSVNATKHLTRVIPISAVWS
jgi:hypothetical protein